MFRRLILAGVTAALPVFASAAPIGSFTDLVVFGDSLSDPGNIFALSGGIVPNPLFYPNGQFTNGDTWATKLGADKASGTNFAFGGATASTNGDTIPDFAAQRALFGAAVSGGLSLGARPLAAVWFGGNDLRDAFGAANPGAIITQAVTDLVVGVNTLLASGLSDILVLGLPNLGRIPEVTANGAGAIAAATGATLAFNGAVQGALAAPIASGNVRYFDTFALFESIVGNASAFGFTNSTDACLLAAANPLTCAGDAGFLFHDTIHPTDRAHTLLANAVRASVVPLPAGGILLITALGGLVALRRRSA